MQELRKHCRPEAFEAFAREVYDLDRADALLRGAIAISMHERPSVDTGRLIARVEALAERGRIIAETYCSECHATGASGTSPMAEAPPLRTFHERWDVENLAEALAEGIMVGHEEMPEFRMTTYEIDAFLAYLESF